MKKAATITKEELANLPMASYHGEVIIVDSFSAAEEAVNVLKMETIIGFDTETKPSFKRGQTNNVALLQLSTHNCCYLIRLNQIGLPEGIKGILENENITKIGVSIHDDFHNLKKLYPISPQGFIDLQQFVKKYNIADNSLARIYGILFGQRISKGQRLTNWEAEELTSHQQAYAALDALACIEIYDHLAGNNFNAEKSPFYRLIETPIPKQASPNETKHEKD